MYLAQDVMNEAVVTLSPKATLAEAIETLLRHGISGAPVVNEQGNLVGVITEYQLLEVIYAPEAQKDCVATFMTREVLTVTEHTNLADVATLFISRRIRRLPVVRGTRMVGLISRRDVLRYALEAGREVDAAVSETRAFALGPT